MGGDKTSSGLAYSEFLQNMTYQALSQENDSVELAFDQGINLAHSIVNALNKVVAEESKFSSDISERVSDALEFTFNSENETEKFIEKEPIQSSTPLSNKEMNSLYDQEKEDYLKASLQINAVDLDSAAQKAKIDNQKIYQEIVNPTPGLVVDNKIEIDKQFDSIEEVDETNLSNATQKRLNKTL